jgi:hypothetical protein
VSASVSDARVYAVWQSLHRRCARPLGRGDDNQWDKDESMSERRSRSTRQQDTTTAVARRVLLALGAAAAGAPLIALLTRSMRARAADGDRLTTEALRNIPGFDQPPVPAAGRLKPARPAALVGAPLRHAPPPLTEAEQIDVPPQGGTWTRPGTVDVVLRLPEGVPVTGDVVLDGSRHVHVIGGELTDARLVFANTARAVYVEGVHIRHSRYPRSSLGGEALWIGDTARPAAKRNTGLDVCIQNCRFGPLYGQDEPINGVAQNAAGIRLAGIPASWHRLRLYNIWVCSNMFGIDLGAAAGHRMQGQEVRLERIRLDHFYDPALYHNPPHDGRTADGFLTESVRWHAAALLAFAAPQDMERAKSLFARRRIILGDHCWVGFSPRTPFDDAIIARQAVAPNAGSEWGDWARRCRIDKVTKRISWHESMNIAGALNYETPLNRCPLPTSHFGGPCGQNYVSRGYHA